MDLYCNSNQLTALNLSTNIALYNLVCDSNQLTALDLSTNTTLNLLHCHSNQITALDLSTTSVRRLRCNDNQLSHLNVQNNNNSNTTNLLFQAQNNPNLNCIQVDDTTYSNTTWTNIDAGTVFSQDAVNCSLLNDISTIGGTIPNLNAYPNPTSKNVSINLGKTYNNINIEVHNTVGQLVFSNNYTAIQHLDLELEGATGIYFVKVQTEAGEATIKVVKQ